MPVQITTTHRYVCERCPGEGIYANDETAHSDGWRFIDTDSNMPGIRATFTKGVKLICPKCRLALMSWFVNGYPDPRREPINGLEGAPRPVC